MTTNQPHGGASTPLAGDYERGVVSIDGRVVPIGEARVPAMDHGFLFGDSIYEVVRTWSRRPVAMAEHLARLRASASALYMTLPWTDAEISARMREAADATDFPECYVRLIVTRGAGPMSLLPDGCEHPSMLVYVLPLRTPSAADLAKGASVAVPARLRNDTRALAPSAKTGNYLNNLLALVEAKKKGADDAVLLNCEGQVTESTTANVFWARDGRLFTPAIECGILAGITRTLLLAALREARTPVSEGCWSYADMAGADEVLLTGTVRGVFPVVRIDGGPVGAGVPGPVAQRLMALYDSLLEKHARDW